MQNRISQVLIIAGLLAVVSPQVVQAEKPQSAADVSHLLMQIIDAVIEHHVDPPTRQQLVLEAIQYTAEEQGQSPPSGLSARISAADPDSLESLLATELATFTDDGDSDAENQSQATMIAQAIIPGGVWFESRETHRVNQQLAGNRYVGIGIASGYDNSVKMPQVAKVFAGGPAAKAGLRDGDLIESVDGQLTQGHKLAEMIKWLRGAQGTDVTVTVRQPRAEKPRQYTITRDIVALKFVEPPAYSSDGRVAAIGIREITASTVHELQKIEPDLPDTIELIVLDFRNLNGFNLHYGTLLASALIDGGVIGQVETPSSVETVTAEPGALFGERKVAVAINKNSHGTPQWIAAAVERSPQGAGTIGSSQADAFVTSGVPIADRDLIAEFPTARLRRANGALFGPLPQNPIHLRMVARTPVPVQRKQSANPSQHQRQTVDPSQILFGPTLKDLANETARWYFGKSNAEPPKE